MTLPGFLRELLRRDRVLAAVALAHLVALAAFVVAAPFDARTVTGVNPWLKPIKFAASIAIYTGTVAWLLPHVRGAPCRKALVRWGIASAMTLEMACIALQAARGTTSHYNVATPFDSLVFNLMGYGILANTVFLAVLFGLFLARPAPLPRPYLWGIRLGLLVILLGSAEGMVMILNRAHTVGAPDGGPGLPLVGWSGRAGDLRIAHALGLHAFQAFPLFGWAVSARAGPRAGIALVFAFAAFWTAVAAWLFAQAMAGRPLLG